MATEMKYERQVMVSIPLDLIEHAGFADGDILKISAEKGKVIIEKENGTAGFTCSGDCDNCPVSETECDMNCASCPCRAICGGEE